MKGPKRPSKLHKDMKTSLKLLAGLALLASLAGCVVTSVYPFYTAKDVVFDPALVDNWAKTGSNNASNEHWQFEKMDSQAYKLTVQDQQQRTEFDAHLFKLKDRLFLDICPRERPDHSLPLHYLLRVARIEPELEMNLLDFDWLKKCLEQDPKAIRHIVVPKKLGEDGDGDLALTADTAELQAFLIKHEKTEGVFGESMKMTRYKP